MQYLILAIITSTIIFILFKYFEKFRISNIQAITTNYLVAVALGYCTSHENITASGVLTKPWLNIALISGCILMLTFIIYAFSVQKAGMAITSVSGKMSVIIPVLCGLAIFHENMTWWRSAGIILAMLAFYLTLKRPSSQAIKVKYLIFPILLFIGNGLNDSLFKISEELYIKNDYTTYLVSAFTISMIIGFIILTILLALKKERLHYKNLIAGSILGVINWYATYFFFIGLEYFDVSVFVPVYNAGVVLIAAIIGYFFFKEKLSKTNVTGILLALLAIIIIAWQ